MKNTKTSNKPMRLSAVLLVMVLLTSCFVGGTFAKYTTQGVGEDTARVAKWGVEVTSSAVSNTFSQNYAVKSATDTITTNSVVSSNGNDVIAPGTTGEMGVVTISGTPEVAVKVTNDATLTLANWGVDGAENYCPLIFTVNGEEYYIGKSEITNATQLKSAVEAAINKSSEEFNANSPLDNECLSVSWRWEIDGTTSVSNKNDTNDTKLGDLEEAPTVELSVTTTVTQID